MANNDDLHLTKVRKDIHYIGGDVDTFRHKNEVLEGHCAAIGRDPKTIEHSIQYSSRWPIEDFHRGVKTGCRLEQRHLQEQGSLENLLAIVSPIAMRLLQLCNLCREEPEQLAMVWVEPEEAQVIASQQDVAVERLSIEQFVFSVAQLGGFLRPLAVLSQHRCLL